MTYIVFFALLLLITLLASYLIVENNRKKAIEAKKKLFNVRVSQVNTRLKLKLNELLDAELIRPKYLPRIQAIVSNFFVVQAHTDENLNQLESTADLLINILSNELIKTYQSNVSQNLVDNIQYFVAELPLQGILYNKTFYQTILPALIVNIKTEDIEQLADNINNADETSETNSHSKIIQDEEIA